MNTKRRAPDTEAKRTSGLRQLVAAEESLEARVHEARAEAARILQRAREAAAAAWQQLEQELTPATSELLAGIRADARAEAEALERSAHGQIAAYEAVTGERLDELARWVVQQVVGPPPMETKQAP